ncbi:MAG: hypothetical protein Fur0044_23880 [Anaerolineae bacterium]
MTFVRPHIEGLRNRIVKTALVALEINRTFDNFVSFVDHSDIVSFKMNGNEAGELR